MPRTQLLALLIALVLANALPGLVVDGAPDDHTARAGLLADYLQEDRPQDGRAIVWDGATLSIEDDPLDMPDILDGRGGPYLVEDHAAAGLTLPCPIWPAVVYVDEPDHYLAADDSWFVEVVRGGRGTLDAWLERHALADVRGREAMDAPRHIQGIGFLSGAGRLYLGHVLLVDADDADLLIAFGGIGSYEDIWTMAGFVYGAQWHSQ